jgi:predicted acetylornithine/succinylornithine family transaminase
VKPGRVPERNAGCVPERNAGCVPERNGEDPLMPTYPPPPATFVRGQGSRLWDAQGHVYLDFVGGLAVTSLGHAHPAVADALAEQARTLLHVSNLYGTTVAAEVARTLDRLLAAGPGQLFFCNSGAEANECAIKLARKWAGDGRYAVISADRSFHGRTLATLHATGNPLKHVPFQPLPEGFRHVPYGDLDALAPAVASPDVAAVLLEAVQGEGGVWEAPPGYLEGARRLCDEKGVLLMLDEVQTGLGRTGRWFGFQHSGIRPDVVTMAKALGNGVPIGACWAAVEVSSAFVPGDHATTFGGQPLATSAARAVLAVMEAEDVPARATRAGARLRAGLAALSGVASVRGLGLLLAAELSDRPAMDVSRAALEAGLLVNAVTPTAVRLAPSLLVSDEEIDEAVAILGGVLAEVAA